MKSHLSEVLVLLFALGTVYFLITFFLMARRKGVSFQIVALRVALFAGLAASVVALHTYLQ